MNYILFDGPVREALFPFTLTRPVADIRVGILTIREKWEKYLNTTTTTITEDYLEEKYPMVEMDENILLNSSFIPNEEIVNLVKELKENEAIFYNEDVIAFFTKDSQEDVDFSNYKHIEYKGDVLRIENTWDIFSKNADALQADFDFITEGRESEPLSDTNRVINPGNIFLEEGAKVEFAILNATDGPIYVGKDAEIWEGSIIRGALALCEHATVKLGAKIYGATTVGPHSKIGGEVNNSVIFGYSSKGHDGF